VLLAALVLRFLRLADPVVVEHVVADDRAVDDEFAFPIPLGVEAGEEELLGAGDGVGNVHGKSALVPSFLVLGAAGGDGNKVKYLP